MPSLTALRIGLFIDGNYFNRASTFFSYVHPRRARLAPAGFVRLVEGLTAERHGLAAAQCRVVSGNHFRGRLNPMAAPAEMLHAERLIEDSMLRAGIQTWNWPTKCVDGQIKEKGIDVLLTIKALQAVQQDRLDVIVLLTGDSDFAPLVQTLRQQGVEVVTAGFPFEYEHNGTHFSSTLSNSLRKLSDHCIDLTKLVDEREGDSLIDGMFGPRLAQPVAAPAVAEAPQTVTPIKPAAPTAPAAPRRFAGIVRSVLGHKGLGYITPEKEVRFTADALRGCQLDDLRAGMRVTYVVEHTPAGQVIKDVQVDAEALRFAA